MSPANPVRTLVLAGVVWTVSEVRRPGLSSDAVQLLVFDSPGEQRWLSPVPPEWSEWDEVQLQDACLRACTSVASGVRFPA
jgi:hypothetical protein